MKKIILVYLFASISQILGAQTQTLTHLKLNPDTGNGISFWNSDNYKISMGNTPDYQYGPVKDFSIKSNMFRSNTLQNRGWTWGSNGETPIAALRTDGTLQIANNFINEGRIGIGTDSPRVRLHITTPTNPSSLAYPRIRLENKHFAFDDVHYSFDIAAAEGSLQFHSGVSDVSNFNHSSSDMDLIARFSAGRMTIFEDHNLPILSVTKNLGINFLDNFKVKPNGFLFARQVEVIGSGAFPDYVFDADYQLRPLGEVAEFIAEHHHLPEVPSAEEVQTNGHNLRDMDEVLLKKVEELTLYLLEMKKENEELKQRVADLEGKGE